MSDDEKLPSLAGQQRRYPSDVCSSTAVIHNTPCHDRRSLGTLPARMNTSNNAEVGETFHRRYHPRGTFRRTLTCEVAIRAARGDVWQKLTCFEGYGDWNKFTTSIQGNLGVGQFVDITVHMLKPRPFVQREWINLLRAPEVICWGTHVGPPFMLTTNRWQTLREDGDKDTIYRNELQVSGLLAPVVMMMYGAALARAFTTAAESLKSACES